MSGNVGGTDGNQVNITPKRPLNLAKLDSLAGKSTAGSIWAEFDTAEKGGNANNVFDADEITAIKTYLSNEPNVSAEMLAYFDSENSKPNVEEQQPQQPAKDTPPPTDNITFTNYTVQPGDTPEKLADKFGLQGEEADAFIKHLKKQTNRKGWFMVGQKITLLGEHSEKIKNIADYSEDKNVLQNRWTKTESGQKAIRMAEAKRQATQQKLEDTPKPPVVEKKKPAPSADKTPKAQRGNINNIRQNAKTAADALKNQIEDASLNSNTRAMLDDKVKNLNVAYILEAYPDLVKDIDDEWGMDVEDVKKYVINPLNSRLRELGMNKHCIPNDLSKFNMDQIQKSCNNIAKLIRNIDSDNGYVFIPTKGNEGKIHQPRKASQKGHVITALPKKTVNKSNHKANNKPVNQPNVLLPGEYSYPEEMQKFILEQRAKGIEYLVKAQGREYVLTIDYARTKVTNLLELNNSVKFDVKTPFSLQAEKTNSVKTRSFKVDVPFDVQSKIDTLKSQGINAEMKKNKDGSYTITQINSENNAVKSIIYKYNPNGDLQYQLNASATDKSVKIGRINPKTKKLEFKQFKNLQGILQQIPTKVSQKAAEIRQDGGQAQVIKGYETFTIVQTKGTYLKKNGFAKVEYKYSPFGVLLAQVNTYKNGRTETYYDVSKRGNDAAHIPNPITIPIPPQYQGKDTDSEQMIYGLNTKGPKDTAQRFAKSLENNKAKLMSSLRLTNEEYDNLATLAMGIAEQETHFGQQEYLNTKNEKYSQDGYTDRAYVKKVANEHYWDDDEKANHSQGITQINYSNALKEPGVKKAFEENGIKSFKDFISSPEKQAIATMILLKLKKNTAEGETWQARLQKNNAKIADPNKKLTTNDVIALLWNGAGGVVKRMNSGETINIDTQKKASGETNYSSLGNWKNMDFNVYINGAVYAKNVRTYADKFFASPATNKSGAQHLTQTDNVTGALGASSQKNLGFIGEVVFMPKSWTSASAKQFINENTQLSPNSKKLLLEYISNGLIGFGGKGGLTKDEAMSISDSDVSLMTAQIEKIKAGTITAAQANVNFETNYLHSREFTVSNRSISAASRLTSLRSSNPRNNKMLAGTLNFEIHPSFYAGGKPRHSASYTSGETNYFAVTRSQGVNPYLANGTLVPDRYRVAAEHAEYTATELFESGGRCKNGIAVDIEYSMGIDHKKIRGAGGRSLPNAKDLPQFYNAHPEVFTPIKYVDNGNGTSRELNANDIQNLPCGYYGVFTPGEGFEDQAGHAFVSDGFGGAFADEHDNGKWAHFRNGKGEHGKLDVYGLSNTVVTVYSEKLGRKVNVPLSINPWYLTPEFRELQAQECKKRGLKVPEYQEEFPI